MTGKNLLYIAEAEASAKVIEVCIRNNNCCSRLAQRSKRLIKLPSPVWYFTAAEVTSRVNRH